MLMVPRLRDQYRLYWALLICAVIGVPCHADEPDTSAVRELLVEAWQFTPESKRLADQIFNDHSGNADQHLRFAYILTLIKQRRHSDALPHARDYVTSYPEDVDARWLESWLLLAKRDHTAAASRLAALAEQMASDKGENVLEQKRSLLIESMGQAIGYLEGPVAGSVNDLDLSRSIARMTATFDDDQLLTFQNARLAVQTDYQRRQQEIRQLQFQQQQQRDNERVVMQATLEQQRAALDQKKESVDRSKQQIESAYLERRADLEQRELSAATDVVGLTNQVRNQRSELFLVSAQISQLDAAIEAEPDPVRRAILIARINDLIRLQRFQVADLRIAESNLSAAQTIHAQTRQRQWSVQQQYQQEYSQLEKSRNVVEKQEKRVQRQFFDLVEPETRSPAQVRALQKRATSLTTYVPLPLEQHRQEVLKRLNP